MQLAVQLVTWNGAKYIPYLFDSLRKQNFADFKVYILDNASEDDTVSAIQKELETVSFAFELIQSKENTGFAGGHNILLKKHADEYVLLLNQDMYLRVDCFSELISYLESHADVAVVSPRLMRWDFSKEQETRSKRQGTNYVGQMVGLTDSIDSLGLKVFKNRRVVEQYTAKEWHEVKKYLQGEALPVFGVSGALPVFRRSDLDEVLFEDRTMFDASYVAYKEDVDLAYRLVSAGKKAAVVLDAVAYHDRSAAGPDGIEDRKAAKNKKTQSSWVKYHSYKNHLMTLRKNEYWQNVILDLPWIMWYELKKFVWFVLFDRAVLKGLGEVRKARKELKKKRGFIQKHQKIGWREMRKWFE